MTAPYYTAIIKDMEFLESDNFNAEQIAEERSHLSEILDCIKTRIQELKCDGFSYRAVNIYDDNDVEEYRTDKFRHDERLYDIKVLEGCLGTPYFARLKMRLVSKTTVLDTTSMTRMRKLIDDDGEGDELIDIYVGAHVVFFRGNVIIYSHNSPLGNKVYERFDGGTVEYGCYKYKVIFRRKFDIRGGKLLACFQDYSSETGGIVYDKFLAHMLKVKRGDKRLTDIIPTIQANQNAIITRPAEENLVVSGCAGCGKTMILLQRLEYLMFNKKVELSDTIIVAPGERYIEHIRPVVDDLMLSACRRLTMAELYRDIILSLNGVSNEERHNLKAAVIATDSSISKECLRYCYSDDFLTKLRAELEPIKQFHEKRRAHYIRESEYYERQRYAFGGYDNELKKPKRPAVMIPFGKLNAYPAELSRSYTKARLYVMLFAYSFVLGKSDFAAGLYIDEAQDYNFNEYRLIKSVAKCTVNLFGDVNQTVGVGGIGDFARIDELFNVRHYSLNENYRNAAEITAYVNELTGMNVVSLGLPGGSIRRVALCDIELEAKNTDDRVAVIYGDCPVSVVTRVASAVGGDAMSVFAAKGMEFETVFVCGDMSRTERYVAYTRALKDLVIVDM